MKNYAPYLLYQTARFGALKVSQMIQICQGRCARSSLYRSLDVLVKGSLVFPLINPATRTRAYYATLDGRRIAFGSDHPMNAGVKFTELDHTIQCADVLIELCHYENVTGVSTQFEIGSDEVRNFCFERVPDGIVRLSQDGEHFELAVEVESTVRNSARINQVLEAYWQTFRRGMECYGLLVVAMSPVILAMYKKALDQRPPEFQSRVRLLLGPELSGIRPEAFGRRIDGVPKCLDFTRTKYFEEISYSPVKADVLIAQADCTTHTPPGQDN